MQSDFDFDEGRELYIVVRRAILSVLAWFDRKYGLEKK